MGDGVVVGGVAVALGHPEGPRHLLAHGGEGAVLHHEDQQLGDRRRGRRARRVGGTRPSGVGLGVVGDGLAASGGSTGMPQPDTAEWRRPALPRPSCLLPSTMRSPSPPPCSMRTVGCAPSSRQAIRAPHHETPDDTLRGMATDGFRVGFVTGATPDKWARTWRERTPRSSLELVPVTEAEQEAGLRNGSLDACLVRLPIDRTDLHCIPLYDEVAVVVAGAEHWSRQPRRSTSGRPRRRTAPAPAPLRLDSDGGPAGLAADVGQGSPGGGGQRHRHRPGADVGGPTAPAQGHRLPTGERPRAPPRSAWPG